MAMAWIAVILISAIAGGGADDASETTAASSNQVEKAVVDSKEEPKQAEEPKQIESTTEAPDVTESTVQYPPATVDEKNEEKVVAEPSKVSEGEHDVVLHFPAERYTETAAHIIAAIEKGESAVCTIDRDGADQNRDESLKVIPTKKGHDRDEWPMAMCAEGAKELMLLT